MGAAGARRRGPPRLAVGAGVVVVGSARLAVERRVVVPLGRALGLPGHGGRHEALGDGGEVLVEALCAGIGAREGGRAGRSSWHPRGMNGNGRRERRERRERGRTREESRGEVEQRRALERLAGAGWGEAPLAAGCAELCGDADSGRHAPQPRTNNVERCAGAWIPAARGEGSRVPRQPSSPHQPAHTGQACRLEAWGGARTRQHHHLHVLNGERLLSAWRRWSGGKHASGRAPPRSTPKMRLPRRARRALRPAMRTMFPLFKFLACKPRGNDLVGQQAHATGSARLKRQLMCIHCIDSFTPGRSQASRMAGKALGIEPLVSSSPPRATRTTFGSTG